MSLCTSLILQRRRRCHTTATVVAVAVAAGGNAIFGYKSGDNIVVYSLRK